jgi:hypothetical protein
MSPAQRKIVRAAEREIKRRAKLPTASLTPEQRELARVLLEPLKFQKLWPLPEPPEACCPSCRVPYIEHKGLNGTCATLQLALSTMRGIALMKGQKRAAAVAGAAVLFIETQLEESRKAGRELRKL